MRNAPIVAAAPATPFRPFASVASVLLVAGVATASPAALAATPACQDLQARIDHVMGPLAVRVGEADVIDVVLHVENGRVARVDATGSQPDYERGLQRGLREVECGGPEANGERRLRVLVVDRWQRLPAGAGVDRGTAADIPG